MPPLPQRSADADFFSAFGPAVPPFPDADVSVPRGSGAFRTPPFHRFYYFTPFFAFSQVFFVIPFSVADGIYTHFPEGADDTIDKGRLGEECARLRDIFEEVSENSFVLLDESLSSTGSYEASYIAAEVLAGFSRIGCRCLFSTHLHELAAEIDNINARTAADGGTTIDSLVAGIESGKRSFKIVRMKPDGKSYARDIADKYGLSYENIVLNFKK